MTTEQNTGIMKVLAETQQASDSIVAELTKGAGGFLPSIRLAAPLSKPVRYKKVEPGMFYLSDQKEERAIPIGSFNELGPGKFMGEMLCVCGPWRPHALHLINGDTVGAESFNVDDPVFKNIRSLYRSEQDTQQNRYSYGIDQLLWIPPDQLQFDKIVDKEWVAEAKEKFANGVTGVMFFARTAAQYAPANRVPPGTPMLIRSHETTYKGNTWWTPSERATVQVVDPRIAKYFQPDSNGVNTAGKMLIEAAPQFNNPVVNTPEILEASEAGGNVRPR